MPKSRHILALFLILVASFYSRWDQITGSAYTGKLDDLTQLLPWVSHSARALQQGRIPLWDQHIFGGMPFVANSLTAVFLPFHWLYILGDMFKIYGIVTALYSFFAGLGMYWLLQRWRLQGSSVVYGTFLYMFNLYSFLHMGWMTVGVTIATLPYIIIAVESMKSRPRTAFGGLIILFSLQHLSGYPFGAYFAFVFAVGYGVLGFSQEFLNSRTHKWHRQLFSMILAPVALIILSMVVASMAAGVQLLPLLEFKSHTKYASQTYTQAIQGSIRLHEIPSMFIGKPLDWEKISSFSWVVPILLGVSLLGLRRGVHQRIWIMLIFSGLTLLGDSTPFYKVCFHLVPGWSSFRVPARCLFLFVFCVSALSALGLAWLLEKIEQNLSRGKWVGVCFVMVYVVSLTSYSLLPKLEKYLQATTLQILDPVDKCQTVSFLKREKEPSRSSLFLPRNQLEFTTGTLKNYPFYWELLPLNMAEIVDLEDFQGYSSLKVEVLRDYFEAGQLGRLGLITTHAAVLTDAASPLLSLANVKYLVTWRIFDYEVLRSDVARDIFVSASQPFRARIKTDIPLRKISLISSLGNALGLRSGELAANLNIYDIGGFKHTYPLRAGIETAEWAWEKPANKPFLVHGKPLVALSFTAGEWPETFTGHHYRAILDDCGDLRPSVVELEYVANEGHLNLHLLALHWEEKRSLIPAKQYRQVYQNRHVRIFQNKAALSRVRWYPMQRVQCYPRNRQILYRMGDDGFAPDEILFIKGEYKLDEQVLPTTKLSPIPIRPLKAESGHLVFETNCEVPGAALISQVDYPGWQALVDGTEASIHSADGIFQAVMLNAGKHRVVLAFVPFSFRLGLYFTLLAMAISIGLWGRDRRNQTYMKQDYT